MKIERDARETPRRSATHDSAAVERAVLDLDDVSAEIAQDLAGVGRHDDGSEFHHPHAVQWPGWCLV